MVPSGPSVMTWFIRNETGGGATRPSYSSRMARAASIHAADRNGNLSLTPVTLPAQTGGAVPPEAAASSERARATR